MSRVDVYEMLDEVIAKENNKNSSDVNKKKVKEIVENLKGGEGFVCGIECKTCGNG